MKLLSRVILASLAVAGPAVADVNNYGIPFDANAMEETSSDIEKNTLSTDHGLVLTENEPVVISANKTPESSLNMNDRDKTQENYTATAGASKNANRKDNPAVDGVNVQPVPNNVVSPIRLTDETIPSRQEIIVEPGVNTLIPISLGQINRIVTPFERPLVQKLQLKDVKVTVEGSVIYVYTPNVRPVALYIGEKGDDSIAISLSLVPQRIAPVQATLLLSRKLNNNMALAGGSASPMMYGGNEAKAKKWEQKDNYVETIRNILRTIALGDLPPGYALGNLGSGVSIPNCNFATGTVQDYIRYTFNGGQYISGSQFSVIVGVAQNTGPTTVTVDESLCTHRQMAARALWSRNTLEPGQKTEAYFVLRNGHHQSRTDDGVRPKLAE